ncbi:thermonuclease family protein [Yoonia sp. SS1-5]|uniref:Thermonuclease family protein n=1 Tax=Yoonia rhodophyticola TaxID=3137370 RepID=A0AAN0NLL0_9RHOB
MRFILALLLASFSPAASAALEGPIHVIDADTFDVGQVRVRLHGIDAPELGQPCNTGTQQMDCGRWAKAAVQALYEGQHAQCTAHDRDRYGRVVASCATGGADIGMVLVDQGLARAYLRYSDRYALAEKAAALAGQGLWAFEIMSPESHRAARRSGQIQPGR